MLVRRLSAARTVIRTGDTAYLDTWRGGDLDVDFIVSTEFQTASAVARQVGVPGTRQADFFLDGEVQVLQLDVSRGAPPVFSGPPLAKAGLPGQSRVVSIVRNGEQVLPSAGDNLQSSFSRPRLSADPALRTSRRRGGGRPNRGRSR